MKNEFLTAGQAGTISENMRQIEQQLGHPIPRGLVSMDDISDHILTAGEMATLLSNIALVEEVSGIRRDREIIQRAIRAPKDKDTDMIEGVVATLFFGAGVVMYLYDSHPALLFSLIGIISVLGIYKFIKKFSASNN